jgi:hypothetical protein
MCWLYGDMVDPSRKRHDGSLERRGDLIRHLTPVAKAGWKRWKDFKQRTLNSIPHRNPIRRRGFVIFKKRGCEIIISNKRKITRWRTLTTIKVIHGFHSCQMAPICSSKWRHCSLGERVPTRKEANRAGFEPNPTYVLALEPCPLVNS